MPTVAVVNDCIGVLRRRIGDTETPYTYTDDLLYGFISDAVDSVELDYHRGIEVSLTIDPTSKLATGGTYQSSLVLTKLDTQLFAIKAHYLLTLRTKSQSDRNNFRMVKGRLTLDNTNQSDDHELTLQELSKEYIRYLVRLKNGGGSIKGVRIQ